MKNPELYGLSTQHLHVWRDCQVHRSIVADVDHLEAAAQTAGFTLGIASAFRDFDRQLAIWNDKALGRRPLLDDDEKPLDYRQLSHQELILRILRWSALPGASRHHWGTDFDVYDAGAVAAGYRLQLTHAETAADGVFADFYLWLEEYLHRHGDRFFRPYLHDAGGVASEPWHLSHTQSARQLQQHYSLAQLRELLQDADIALKQPLLQELDSIYERFIVVSWDLYPGT